MIRQTNRVIPQNDTGVAPGDGGGHPMCAKTAQFYNLDIGLFRIEKAINYRDSLFGTTGGGVLISSGWSASFFFLPPKISNSGN